MRLDDGYRLLDLDPAASDEEVKRACRDLTKVWHPDRFGDDPRLRQKAEEKLKAILEAYETIRAARAGGAPGARPGTGDGARDEAPPPAEAGGDGSSRVRRYGTRALVAAAVAVFLLLRRPTPAGLVIAVVLLGLSAYFVSRMRSAGRESQDPRLTRRIRPRPSHGRRVTPSSGRNRQLRPEPVRSRRISIAFVPMSRRKCFPSKRTFSAARHGAGERLGEAPGPGGDDEDPAAGGDELSVRRLRRPGVEGEDPVLRGRRPRSPRSPSRARTDRDTPRPRGRRPRRPPSSRPAWRSRRTSRGPSRGGTGGGRPPSGSGCTASRGRRTSRCTRGRTASSRSRASGRRRGRPRNGRPSSAMPRSVGWTMSVRISRAVAASTKTEGLCPPIPPVFGPRSPSKTRL